MDTTTSINLNTIGLTFNSFSCFKYPSLRSKLNDKGIDNVVLATIDKVTATKKYLSIKLKPSVFNVLPKPLTNIIVKIIGKNSEKNIAIYCRHCSFKHTIKYLNSLL